ncbi:sialate O-acetylesterase, partial [Salmonella enterica]
MSTPGGDEVSSQEPVPVPGGATPPVKDETPQPDNTQPPGACCTRTPEYYFVIPVAGQSNMMAYGEGLPLPDTLDAPHPRIKQLARRATVTPGGAACKYNDVIPLDHCPHDVQNMSTFSHPKADLKKGQYGTVGQALHIAKKLLPYIPEEAGILMVPCSRGGAAFTQGEDGAFNAASGATEASARWGTGKPLYQDLLSRTKAALDSNPKNRLLAVVWMQGEFDLQAAYTQHPAQFAALVKQFRTDLADHAAQMPDFKADNVPWICGDTTYYWKNTYPTQYDTVYGGYKTCQEPNVFFVPFLTDENGHNTATNEPAEDPDIPAAHYYGSASRTSSSWVSSLRGSHFSSWARRDIIPTRLASAILLYAGRKSLLAAPSGSALPATTTAATATTNDTAAAATLSYTPKVDEVGYNGRRGDGTLQQQGWSTVS